MACYDNDGWDFVSSTWFLRYDGWGNAVMGITSRKIPGGLFIIEIIERDWK